MNAANKVVAELAAWIENGGKLGFRPESKAEAIEMWLDGLTPAEYRDKSRDFMQTNTQAREAFHAYVEAAYDLEHPSMEGE